MKWLIFIFVLFALKCHAQGPAYVHNFWSTNTAATNQSAALSQMGIGTNQYTLTNDTRPLNLSNTNNQLSGTFNGTVGPSLVLFTDGTNTTGGYGTNLFFAYGYYISPKTTCPLIISNGSSGYWNSNGVATYLRTSQTGSTNTTDHLIAVH